MKEKIEKYMIRGLAVLVAFALVVAFGANFGDSSLKATDDAGSESATTEKVVVKVEAPPAPKPEAPKPEAPKAEDPKPEAPKAEPPKAEEPKAETPKAEEPKVETPKTEEVKTEEVKSEEPKAEAPKNEEAKSEETKVEEVKNEDGKVEAAAAEETNPTEETETTEATEETEAAEEAEEAKEVKECTCGAEEGQPHAEDCPLFVKEEEKKEPLEVSVRVETPEGCKPGAHVYMYAVVSGADANEVTYQWQKSSDNEHWTNAANGTGSRFEFVLDETTSGLFWHVVVHRK